MDCELHELSRRGPTLWTRALAELRQRPSGATCGLVIAGALVRRTSTARAAGVRGCLQLPASSDLSASIAPLTSFVAYQLRRLHAARPLRVVRN